MASNSMSRTGLFGRRGARHGMALLALMACVAFTGKGRGWKSWLLGKKAATRHTYQASLMYGAHLKTEAGLRFEQVSLQAAQNIPFTCVQVGPDHRLYAGADDGRLFRFQIAADGTLGPLQVLPALQEHAGRRLLTGFCFDPCADADHLVIWASHGYPSLTAAEDWSGTLSRLSGADLETVEDVVVHLPRSVRDHLNNQPIFGPDGALYFCQGSITARGAPDPDWGGRSEHLLSASILRLDPAKLTPGIPLDVRTADGAGCYDPSDRNAPLTLYATGVRNAFDLVWADNGCLYAPVNGSSAGGNSPAGPDVPALVDIPTEEHDWLIRILPGRYYGHPNPQQGHFVLNGANPAGTNTCATVAEYPIGTLPDPMWEAPIYDFGLHVSPNGIIQYHGTVFHGRLDRTLLVCRYNVGSDLICLRLDSDGNVCSTTQRIEGFCGLRNPLALAEDLENGSIYVAEYGARRITLLRPAAESSSNVSTAFSHARPLGGQASDRISMPAGDQRAARGKRLFETTCFVCHGATGDGVPGLGPSLRDSAFISTHGDDALVAFLKVGRQPSDPNSRLHMTMPARGGNPALDDACLHDLVVFLHNLAKPSTDGGAKGVNSHSASFDPKP